MTATATMTTAQAREFRAAREAELGRLFAKTQRALARDYQKQGGLGGATWSKADLAGSILEHRYPIAQLNLAVHVLHHDVTWPDCRHCAASAAVAS